MQNMVGLMMTACIRELAMQSTGCQTTGAGEFLLAPASVTD